MENYKQIDLNDYVQTSEGGTALTYNHKDGKTLAKLFMPGFAADTAKREFLIKQVVYESGLPTPKPIRLITDGTRFGAEYELISNKRSFTRIISQEPDQLVPLSERFAVLARQIHQTPADTTRLPDMMYYSSHFLRAERADNIFHLDNDTLRAHWAAFAPVYYGTDSKEALEAEVRKLHPFIATKIAFFISKLTEGKHPFSGPLLQLFDKYLPE